MDANLTPQSRWYWQQNSHLGPLYFKIYIADLVTWPLDRISPSTKPKIAKQLHKNSASSFGGTNKPSLESKATYWSFCKSWSWMVSFFSQSLYLDHFSNFLATYPDIFVATSGLSSFHQSFQNFHPRYSQVVVGPSSKSLHRYLLESGKIKSALCFVLLSNSLRTIHHSFDGIVKNDALSDHFEVEL